MDQRLGSKDGKHDRRLFFLNKKRKQHSEERQEEEKKKKEEEVIKKEKEVIIDITSSDTLEEKEIIVKEIVDTTDKIDKINSADYHPIKKKKKAQKKELDSTETSKEIIEEKKIETKDEEQVTPSLEDDDKKIDQIPTKKTGNNHTQNPEIINNKDYIEKQIITILEEHVDEVRFQLKKIDSELHTLEKEIDYLEEQEDILETEKEIDELIEKLNQIKKQIETIEKTFELDFPIEKPDNYLIYLVDEYIDNKRSQKEVNEKLEHNKKFQSIVDKVIEIEEKYELALEKTQQKRETLNLNDEQVQKMNDSMIDVEEMKQKIEKMINMQKDILSEIKIKVEETVHITEKTEYITKQVNHSLLELFLLMRVLKHNLSIKNNVIAAANAKIALDLILKMTTPSKEKVMTKVSDVKDYEEIIHRCLHDTNKLENIMNENLNNISSIRYTFEHDYKECSYLDSYKEALEKLNLLESEMKERKKDVIKMKKETELQLEKNNAKVKKYGSIAA